MHKLKFEVICPEMKYGSIAEALNKLSMWIIQTPIFCFDSTFFGHGSHGIAPNINCVKKTRMDEEKI
jgi:hypothetical protein